MLSSFTGSLAESVECFRGVRVHLSLRVRVWPLSVWPRWPWSTHLATASAPSIHDTQNFQPTVPSQSYTWQNLKEITDERNRETQRYTTERKQHEKNSLRFACGSFILVSPSQWTLRVIVDLPCPASPQCVFKIVDCHDQRIHYEIPRPRCLFVRLRAIFIVVVIVTISLVCPVTSNPPVWILVELAVVPCRGNAGVFMSGALNLWLVWAQLDKATSSCSEIIISLLLSVASKSRSCRSKIVLLILMRCQPMFWQLRGEPALFMSGTALSNTLTHSAIVCPCRRCRQQNFCTLPTEQSREVSRFFHASHQSLVVTSRASCILQLVGLATLLGGHNQVRQQSRTACSVATDACLPRKSELDPKQWLEKLPTRWLKKYRSKIRRSWALVHIPLWPLFTAGAVTNNTAYGRHKPYFLVFGINGRNFFSNHFPQVKVKCWRFFAFLVTSQMSSWWLFGRPYFLNPNSVGRLKMDKSLVWWLMVMIFSWDSGKVWAVQIWTLFWRAEFRNVFVVTCRIPWEIPEKWTHERIPETTTLHLIGVFDAGRCRLFTVFAQTATAPDSIVADVHEDCGIQSHHSSED